MAKLITKFRYLKPSRKRKAGGYATYIATREGVEKLPQEKTYADYIATRPRSQGLFSDEDVEINLRQLSRELNLYQGNLWTVILSLSREDAERLGFDTATRWRDFLRSERSEIAEQFHIPQGNLRWYAAFHNEKHHPHVHLMVWSEDEKEGYLSEKGIEKLRASFVKSIFAQDWCNVYDRYTEARNTLRQESRERMRKIVESINAGTYENKTIENLLLQLARQLSTTTGKKQYGYLKPELKRLVDAIVTEFAKNPHIAELYDLWYDQKESGIRFYQDEMPERVSLVDNPEFRTVKNMILQEAENLAFADLPVQITQEKQDRKEAEQTGTGIYNLGKHKANYNKANYNKANYNTKHNHTVIATTVARLFVSLAQLLYDDPDRRKISKIDRKQRRQIDEKKLAQGMKLE